MKLINFKHQNLISILGDSVAKCRN